MWRRRVHGRTTVSVQDGKGDVTEGSMTACRGCMRRIGFPHQHPGLYVDHHDRTARRPWDASPGPLIQAPSLGHILPPSPPGIELRNCDS